MWSVGYTQRAWGALVSRVGGQRGRKGEVGLIFLDVVFEKIDVINWSLYTTNVQK